MVVLLVVAMFLVFVAVDAVVERRRRVLNARETEARHSMLQGEEPSFVAGYELPQGLHYHQGHTWVHWVSPEEAYVGVDDFARRLLGKETTLQAPPRGAWVRQGENAIEAQREGHQVRLLSPVSGEVVGVNPAVKTESGLINRDAYGRGWLYKIKAADLHNQIANLLSGSLAKRWMEDTRDRFQHQLMLATGNVIQDGGAPIEDLASHLDPDQWEHLADEFLSLEKGHGHE